MFSVDRVWKQIVFFGGLLFAGVIVSLRENWVRSGWRTRGVSVARGAIVRARTSNAIELGSGVAIGAGTLLIATAEKSTLPLNLSHLRIGAGTAINEYCNLRACGGSIEIGKKCLLAQFVTIVASNHGTRRGTPMIDQYWADAPHSVWIGDDVWLGAGVIVLPGARIGGGAVIAAGAVVRGDIPSGQVWGGVPARFLKHRDPSEISDLHKDVPIDTDGELV